jgi:hypothetical protein
MVRSCARGGIARRLRHGVPKLADIVAEVGGIARAGSRVVFAQADSWSDRNFRERRTKARMDGILGVWPERSRRLGELSALVEEFLCHRELSSGTEEAEGR